MVTKGQQTRSLFTVFVNFVWIAFFSTGPKTYMIHSKNDRWPYIILQVEKKVHDTVPLLKRCFLIKTCSKIAVWLNSRCPSKLCLLYIFLMSELIWMQMENLETRNFLEYCLAVQIFILMSFRADKYRILKYLKNKSLAFSS